MTIEHIELSEANEFVARVHRHHKPAVGHRFSIAAKRGDVLVGVAVVGRPVARMTDQRNTVEVTRLATDGAKNACSFLYAAAARAASSLGYLNIQTFILASEPGTSLIAAGWKMIGPSSGGDWNRPSRDGRRMDQPQEPKVKYGKTLREESRLNMGPRNAMNNRPNSCISNPVFLGLRGNGSAAFGSNTKHLIFRESCRMNSCPSRRRFGLCPPAAGVTSRASVFLHSVVHVILICAEEKMRCVAARAIVAVMKNAEAIGNWTICHLVGESVRLSVFVVKPTQAVTARAFVRSPRPTLGWCALGNVFPKCAVVRTVFLWPNWMKWRSAVVARLDHTHRNADRFFRFIHANSMVEFSEGRLGISRPSRPSFGF